MSTADEIATQERKVLDAALALGRAKVFGVSVDRDGTIGKINQAASELWVKDLSEALESETKLLFVLMSLAPTV